MRYRPYVERHRPGRGHLTIWAEENGRNVTFDLAVFNVFNPPDNFQVGLRMSAVTAHTFSNRIGSQMEFLDELLVNHNHFGSTAGVGFCKLAAGNQRNSQGVEVSRSD